MSRSYKKSPVITCGSGKWFKQKANRKLRHKVKTILKKYPDQDILPILREVSNVYDSNKDGMCCLWLDNYEHIGRYSNLLNGRWSIDHYGRITYTYQTPEEEYTERLESYKKALRK